VSAEPLEVPSLSWPVVSAVARRPDLWWTALSALARLAAPGWWRRRPHLPVPDARLWSFRMVTAYGRPEAQPVGADVISYLEWCRTTANRGRPFRRATPGPGRTNPRAGGQSG
jgi:hypothetical protein